MPRTGSLRRNALIPVAACLAPHSRARPLDGNPVPWGMVPGDYGADLPVAQARAALTVLAVAEVDHVASLQATTAPADRPWSLRDSRGQRVLLQNTPVCGPFRYRTSRAGGRTLAPGPFAFRVRESGL